MIMPSSSFELLEKQIESNPIQQNLYRQCLIECTPNNTILSRAKIILLLATKLTESENSVLSLPDGELPESSLQTYAEIGALLLYELYPEQSSNSHDAIQQLKDKFKMIIEGTNQWYFNFIISINYEKLTILTALQFIAVRL